MEYFVADHYGQEVIVDETGRRYGRAMEDETVNFTEATGSLGQSQYVSRYTGGHWDDEYPNFAYDLTITDGHGAPHDHRDYHGIGIAAWDVDTFVGRVAAWKSLMSRMVRDENGNGRSATDEELVATEKHLIDEGFLLFLHR